MEPWLVNVSMVILFFPGFLGGCFLQINKSSFGQREWVSRIDFKKSSTESVSCTEVRVWPSKEWLPCSDYRLVAAEWPVGQMTSVYDLALVLKDRVMLIGEGPGQDIVVLAKKLGMICEYQLPLKTKQGGGTGALGSSFLVLEVLLTSLFLLFLRRSACPIPWPGWVWLQVYGEIALVFCTTVLFCYVYAIAWTRSLLRDVYGINEPSSKIFGRHPWLNAFAAFLLLLASRWAVYLWWA